MTYPLVGTPTSRALFAQYCLRKLGKPVIEINVADEQVDDRINDAIQYWMDYHFDGAEKTYYKYQLQDADFVNKYITMPDNIIGAVNVFNPGTLTGIDNMFNIRYQIALNDLYTLTSISLVPYFMTMQNLQFIEYLLIGQFPIRYNRHINRLYLDMDWQRFGTGQFLLVEAYQVVDPDVWTKAWSDRWLRLYATALIKKQWGENLKKFTGMTMPGGVQFNGQQIWNEANEEIEKLEAEMINSYSLPVTDMIG